MADSIQSLIDNFHKEKDGREKVSIVEKDDEKHHHRLEQSDPQAVMQTGDSSETRVSNTRSKTAESMHGAQEWIHKQGISNHKQK